jgi:IS5 family transposase
MKLMLVGYLENLNSDRRIVRISKMRLDILYFLGYDLGEEFPWHSTLSRTRQLYGQEVFSELFKAVLNQCIDKGMISGRRQAVDGVYIKANASLDSMVRNEVMDDADSFARELQENEETPTAKIVNIEKIDEVKHHGLPPKKNPHNSTHFSPSDPDAKMSVKSGKTVALNYLGQVCVDTASHMITHIQAFKADLHDSQCLPDLIPNIIDNLKEGGLTVEEIIADTGYSSGEALRALEENNIIGYIPTRPQFIFKREGFEYQEQGDYYVCPNSKRLDFKGIFKAGNYYNRNYSAKRKECKDCPMKGECQAYGKKYTRITVTVDKPYYDRMYLRMQSKKAKILMKKRQSTVEPVIGTLVNYMGMKRLNTKGLEQANKCMTMSAIAYNLKKLLKHMPKKLMANIQVKEKLFEHLQNNILSYFESLKNLSPIYGTYRN